MTNETNKSKSILAARSHVVARDSAVRSRRCQDALKRLVSPTGGVLVQRHTNGSSHPGNLCVPSLGSGSGLAHVAVLHDSYTRVHDLHVSGTQGHLQRGKEPRTVSEHRRPSLARVAIFSKSIPGLRCHFVCAVLLPPKSDFG